MELLTERLPQETQARAESRQDEREWAAKVLAAKASELRASVARLGGGADSPLAFTARILEGMQSAIMVGRQYES